MADNENAAPKTKTPEQLAREAHAKEVAASVKNLREKITVQKIPTETRTDKHAKYKTEPLFTDVNGAANTVPAEAAAAIAALRDQVREIGALNGSLQALRDAEQHYNVVVVANAYTKSMEFKTVRKALTKAGTAYTKLLGAIEAIALNQGALDETMEVITKARVELRTRKENKAKEAEKSKGGKGKKDAA